MCKFKKSLLLILSFAFIIAAFSVVALATDGNETSAAPVKVSSSTFSDGTFTSSAGTDTYYDKEEKVGKYTIRVSDDGNVYLRSEYAETTGTDVDNLDISVDKTDVHGCSFADYPYLAVDFDVMSENGVYGNYASIAPAIHNGSTRIKAISSNKFSGIGLSATPYEWQHVTLIVEYAGNYLFKQHFYVNGEHTHTTTHDYSADEALTALNGDFSKVSVGYFRMYPSRYASSNGHIGFDNFRFTYFPGGYCGEDSDLTKIATYYYNDSYVLPYKYTVATVTDNNENVSYYDDINEAITAAKEDNVIKLFENVTEAVVVDKKITVDRNVYGESGATGELYTFEYTSSLAFVDTETSEGSGIFNFDRSSDAVDIVWDEACSEDCDCHAEFGGHALTDTTVAVVGNIPEYFGTVPEFAAVDGYVKKFEGWSYENDGIVDELLPLTADDVANGVLKLYPVWSAIQYDFEVKYGEENSEFYFDEKFDEIIANALSTNGATVILHSDIEYYTSVAILTGITSTLDLNGHNLTRINAYGTKYSYDAASGTHVEDGTTDSALNAFTFSSTTNTHFTITSSKEGGVFKTISANGSVYYDENGRIEKYEASAAGYAGLITATQPKSTSVNLKNITIFAIDLVYNSHGNTNNFAINTDSIKFYKTAGAETSGKYGYGCIFIDTANGNNTTISLKNSLFYFPSSSVISGNSQFINVLEKGNVSATIDNCDIISDYASVSVSLKKDTHSAVFNNCRIYNIKNASATFPSTFGNDTVSSKTIAGNSNAADGTAIVAATSTKTYSLPTNSRVTIDASGKALFDFGFADRSISFTHETKLYREVYATVTWLDETGNKITSTEELKNETVSSPEYIALSGDGYRGIKVNKWLDESGALSTLKIGSADEYTFKADPTVDVNTEYVAKITEAQFNFIYYGNFKTILYLPVDCEMNTPSVNGFNAKEITVKINGKEYWSYARDNSTTNVSDDVTATVAFSKGGQDFTQNLTLSALLYAEIVLSYPESDIESRAVANMIRYIKEARTMAGLDISEKFADIEAIYPLNDYMTKGDYDNLGADSSALTDYIDSIRFMLHGSSASYVITLNEDAIANGAVVSMEYAGSGKEITLTKSDILENSYYTENTRVYDLIDLVKITVSVTESGTPKTETGTYSIGAYINSEDIALAKAMYEFGNAAATYREYLVAKYDPESPEVKLYTATFKADGVTVGEVKFHLLTESLDEPGIPDKIGYTGAWESYYITNSDIVVNAIYTPITYKITYNVNNSYATHENPKNYTIETETFEISAPISEGDTFLGWYLDAEFTTAAPTSIEKGTHGDITLYGNWDCIHEIKVTARNDATPLKDGYETTNCIKCYSQEHTVILPATKSIKLLAIGNSFSVDALEYFGAILAEAGVDNITIANLYDAGCSINEHLSFIEAGTSNYTLYLYNPTTQKMVSQGSSADKLVSLEYGLKLDDWDIITMQQASGSSYKPTTYSRLDELVDYVRGYNTTAKLYWHMTWAYDTHYLSGDRTSMDMYTEIVDAVSQMILTRDDFDMLIPAGTAVENMRTSYIGDNMTRDGYHLNYGYGRYTAALTWFAYICGVDVNGVTYVPAAYPEVADMLDVIKEAVTNAVSTPYAVTQSTYPSTDTGEPETPVEPEPEEPSTEEFPTTSTATLTVLTEDDIAYLTAEGYDASGYKLLVLNMEDDTFYNSTGGSSKTTSNTLCSQFASTNIFDRSELIVGSIIRFTKTDANGSTYKYRPEGWVALDKKNASADRPAAISTTKVVVDAEWWGDFYYRAFNIQKANITLTEAEAVFRIYVPVSAQ